MRVARTLLPIVIAALLIACGERKDAAKPSFDAAAEFAKVKTARAALVSARSTLDTRRAELASLNAKARPSAAEQARKAQLEGQLEQAQDAFDHAYENDQQTLTVFLNVALNDRPDAPETREALALYAAQAVRNATVLMTDNGDYAKAIEVLQTAEKYYVAIGARPPTELDRALEMAKTLRYLSRDRFDRVTNGMDQATARLITGTPFYANVHEHDDRGKKIVTWRFARQDGGVATIEFLSGKVVAKTWDAKEGV